MPRCSRSRSMSAIRCCGRVDAHVRGRIAGVRVLRPQPRWSNRTTRYRSDRSTGGFPAAARPRAAVHDQRRLAIRVAAHLPVDEVPIADVEHPVVVRLNRRKAVDHLAPSQAGAWAYGQPTKKERAGARPCDPGRAPRPSGRRPPPGAMPFTKRIMLRPAGASRHHPSWVDLHPSLGRGMRSPRASNRSLGWRFSQFRTGVAAVAGRRARETG